MGPQLTFVWVTALGILRWPVLLVCAALAHRIRRNRRHLAVVVAVVIVFVADMAVENTGRVSTAADAGGGETLTILTHNVLYDGGDAQATIDALLDTDADVLFLQEVSVSRAAVLAAGLSDRYPHRAEALTEGRGHGLVTFAKRPVRAIDSWASGRGNVVGQCVDIDGLASCNIHLSSPSVAFDQPRRFLRLLVHNERYRRQQWAVIEATAEAHGALFLAGDVNTMAVEPHFRSIRRRWVDAWRATNPLDPGATYPHGTHGPPNKFARPGTPFVRPDYVLLDPSVKPLSARTLAAGGSDHRPLVVTVELPQGAP